MRPSIELIKSKFAHTAIIRGCEVGVYVGDHAKEMLEAMPTLKLFLVDPYLHYDDTQIPMINNDDAKWEAHKLLEPFGDRVTWSYASSLMSAKDIDKEYFDFVYIDADHRYSFVLDDIEAWMPSVRAGGIIAGHDFAAIHSVREAVIEYGRRQHAAINFQDNDWWITKK